ncbi:hypothetical protein ASE21_13740 [Flavobacterium sp. Root901]|uniref:glycine-rich domain-containing protein n=1 Tax=Flavobacterium sp. Root901 TaxID=1736605 RepID=UPI00070CAF49|nr:hypothetical protein [Flavobacterium sp. Root901]KRD08911.1 hypothetical protein ASE21_13740 [Flavobacterium sp. Root901]
MNKTLWEKALAFSFDQPNDQYGFSTRLALKNHWTVNFTQSAIIEYKKFMLLAATNNEMVSPSEIVDIVWHEHLIFTNSYTDFCNVLGKRIEHIPSTHNRSEFEKFQTAKERTTGLYEINFGKQPAEIWYYQNELYSLHLEKSKYEASKLRKNFLRYTIIMSFPVCLIIFSLLIKIKNPDFLIGYLLLFVTTILILKIYVHKSFTSLYNKIKSNSILRNLTPLEMVYFKEDKLQVVIHGVVNNLIMSHKIKVLANDRLELIDDNFVENQYENCIIEIMRDFDPMPYQQLCKTAIQKPVFEQIEKATYRIRNRIINSKEFTRVIMTVMIVLGFLLSIGFSRFITGIWRGKPVLFLLIAIVPLVLISRYYLNQVLNLMFVNIIPSSVKVEILDKGENKRAWEWDYFLYGNLLLVNSFIPLTNYQTSSSSWNNFVRSDSSGISCGSSGGGSCGSSCGSSCGGCGGD